MAHTPPLNSAPRTGYGAYNPNVYPQQAPLYPSPWYPNGTPSYGYVQPAVQPQPQPLTTYTYPAYQPPDAYTTNTSPLYSAPHAPFRERLANGFNAFITGLVVDPITLAVDKVQQIARYPFTGKKEALISAGVATATVVAGTILGGYGFVLAPLALTGLILGGKDAFKFLKSQFSDNQSTEQKDSSWRLLAHTLGVVGLVMSLGTVIGNAHTPINGKPFIPFWDKYPTDTKGWKVLHNTPQLAWLDVQSALNGIFDGKNYGGFWNNLVTGAKENGKWLIELPKKAWEATQG